MLSQQGHGCIGYTGGKKIFGFIKTILIGKGQVGDCRFRQSGADIVYFDGADIETIGWFGDTYRGIRGKTIDLDWMSTIVEVTTLGATQHLSNLRVCEPGIRHVAGQLSMQSRLGVATAGGASHDGVLSKIITSAGLDIKRIMLDGSTVLGKGAIFGTQHATQIGGVKQFGTLGQTGDQTQYRSPAARAAGIRVLIEMTSLASLQTGAHQNSETDAQEDFTH